MRHDLSVAKPSAVCALPVGVIQPPFPARLVATSGGSNALPPRRCRARRRAVPIAPITGPTEQKFLRTTRACPRPQPPHSTAVAAAVDFARRPCQARSHNGWIDPCAVGSLRRLGACYSGPRLFWGRCRRLSTTTRRPSAKPTPLCRCHLAPSAAPQKCALARRGAPLRFALPPRDSPAGSQPSRSLHNLSSKLADESRAPPRSP